MWDELQQACAATIPSAELICSAQTHQAVALNYHPNTRATHVRTRPVRLGFIWCRQTEELTLQSVRV